jgi:hypothetical protein
LRYDRIYPYLEPGALLHEPVADDFLILMQEASSQRFAPSECLTRIDDECRKIRQTTS